MTILSAIFQAIVQGLTEFIPISRSGHLALIQHFAGGVNSENAVFLSAIIRLGALVAIIIAFRKLIYRLIVELFCMIKEIFAKRFQWKQQNEYRRMIIMLFVSYIPLLILLPFKGFYDILVPKGSLAFLGLCFIVTSIFLYLSDFCIKREKTASKMTYKNAITIGIAQGISAFPGLSHFGLNVTTSLFNGLSKKFAVQYSFILCIPTILCSSILDMKEAIAGELDIAIFPVLIAFVISTLSGLFAIKLVAGMVQSSKLKIFAYYTLTLGAVVLGISIYEMIF